ncbi:MAG: FAD-dependent monooxygenase [Betaproteobacteria bacterium]
MSAQLVIVGGGPVGLALARAASTLAGVEVTVIERSPAAAVTPPEPFDHRVYALSPSSLGLLREIGANLAGQRMAMVRVMQVWGDGRRTGGKGDGGNRDGGRHDEGRLVLERGQPLAAIVEHAAVMQALQDSLSHGGRVKVLRGIWPVAMRPVDGNRRELELSDGSKCVADLLVAADGSKSQIRGWSGLSVATKDYESDGVVANFRCEHPHGDIARQWFTYDGVMAWLPLPGNHISMVWSIGKEMSASLPSDDATAICRMVEATGHAELGTLSLVSPIARFPLSRIMASQWVQPGLALIGDAAHAVHPLAGQGVNLGFADVRHLVAVLDSRSRYAAIGDLALLRRYERRSREAAWAVGEMTDRLRSLYLSEAMPARWLRNEGVDWLNGLPAAKSLLIDYATG